MDGRGYNNVYSYARGHRYQNIQYDGNIYGHPQYGNGATPGIGSSQNRGVFTPPMAASVNNGAGVGIPKFLTRRGAAPGTRFPNPATAYGIHAYPLPAAPAPGPAPPPPPPPPPSSAGDSRQDPKFGGVSGQLLNAAERLSPPVKTLSGKSTRGTVSNVQAFAHHGSYAPSAGGAGEVPGAIPSRGSGYGLRRSDNEDDRRHEQWRGDNGVESELERGSQQLQQKQHPPPSPSPPLPSPRAAPVRANGSRASSSGSLASGRPPSASGSSGGGRNRSSSSSSSGGGVRGRSSSPRAVRNSPPMNQEPPPAGQGTTAAQLRTASIPASPATGSTPAIPLAWPIIEAAGERQLGGPAEDRRLKPEQEMQNKSPFQGCPIPDCIMARSDGIGISWMTRHLESHTKVAMEKPQKELYIRSSVAEALHEICLDSEVPPSQRKFERKRMSRQDVALLNKPPVAIGHLAGIMETVATGDNPDPNVRRCALDLAIGGCDGVTREDTIVRCDKCRAWYHVTCGQMVLGDGISSAGARDETICRTCARLSIGLPAGKDPTVSLQKQLSSVREKRKKMMEFLEADVKGGAPEAVFGFKLSVEDEDEAGVAPGLDKKDGTADAQGESGGGSGSGGGRNQRREEGRPGCAAARCQKPSRTDSKFCCDACGVLHAEAMLSDALKHTLEAKIGLERGRRLRETRELKSRKNEIGIAMKKVEFPRVPGFKTERETAVQAMVVRRCRLWQRLIEIGAYWEKVSGSRSLAASAKGAAQNSRRQAAVAAAAAAAAAAGNATPDGNGVVGSGSTAAASGASAASAGGGGSAAPPQTAVTGAGGTAEASGSPASNSRQATVAMEIEGGGGVAAPQATPAALEREGGGGTAADLASDRLTPVETDKTGAEPEVEVDVGLDDAGLLSTAVGEAWTYAAVGNMNVVWYCPPGGGEADRLSTRAQLLEFWRRRHGHARIPGCFTFRGKDAPAQWKRTHVTHLSEEARPTKKTKADGAAAAAAAVAAAAAAAAADSATPRIGGVHDLTCVYCGEQAGPRVDEHLELCYRMVIAKRNHRLKHAKLRPLPDQHFLQGGSRSGAASVTEPVAVPATAALDSPAAIGRQLLSRHIAYADFDSLPDPTRFQLHQDLKGWKSSPSRLDFLYKELVRQRNAAIYELQALDKEEAELEVNLRRDWMDDDLRSVPRVRINY
ncbi:unnamed protein product [Pylaiella littoralis]